MLDDAGKPQIIAMANYGIHALRHACASLWIERGMNPKRIQKLMGHSTIQLTFDRYGHLFQGQRCRSARGRGHPGAAAWKLNATRAQHGSLRALY
ncbi:tyrosine-type recombinase/integrase [Bradyrhizobium sp. ma5]|uniref:tyrosine-type recombinase/integrase n=1 Tax=Bradyrhizobium sp. ma5 TaxID=3344828 RepID=UPI0035D43D15